MSFYDNFYRTKLSYLLNLPLRLYSQDYDKVSYSTHEWKMWKAFYFKLLTLRILYGGLISESCLNILSDKLIQYQLEDGDFIGFWTHDFPEINLNLQDQSLCSQLRIIRWILE